MSKEISESQHTSLTSNQGRRDALWNVQQPGDPYDIKKSTIASLPGDKMFMGQKLEIVCLLQAAQIERLTDFFQSFKYKYRDLERKELDRHSYEVQIKELIEKIQNLDYFKKENQKLKDFAQRQENQNKLLNDRLRGNISQEELSIFYQGKVQELERKNIQLRDREEKLQQQIVNFNNRLQSYQKARARQLQELKQDMNKSGANAQSFSQNQRELFRLEIEGQLQKMKSQMNILRNHFQNKCKQVEILKSQNINLQNKLKQPRITKTNSEEELSTLKEEYEVKIVTLNQQVVRLSHLLDQSNRKIQDISQRNMEVEQQMIKNSIFVQQSSQKIRSREQQITRLSTLLKSHEKGQLNQPPYPDFEVQAIIRQRQQTIRSLSARLDAEANSSKMIKQQSDKHINEYFTKIQDLLHQNEQLKRQVLDTNETKRQLFHLQNERILMLQDIERQNELINSKIPISIQNQHLLSENRDLKAKMADIERTMAFKHESELVKLRNQYEHKINQLSQMQGSQLQSRSFFLEQELKKMKDMLREKSEQAERNRIAAFEWQNKFNQLEMNQGHKDRNAEENISHFKRQNQNLNIKLKNYGDLELKLVQSQNKIGILQDQIQRLKQLLSAQDSDSSQKTNQYLQNTTNLRKQNDELKRKLNQVINSSSNISRQTISELERLNMVIKNIQDQNAELGNKNRMLGQELASATQSSLMAGREKEDLRRYSVDVETRLKNVISQNQFNFKKIEGQNQTLKKDVFNMKTAIAAYQAQVSRKVISLENTINSLSNENQDIKRRLRDNQPKLSQYSLDLDNLNQKYKLKCQQLSNIDSKCRNLSSQNQTLKRQFREHEASVASKYQTEASIKNNSYETTIAHLNRDRQQGAARYAELQTKCNKLNNQVTQLSLNLKRANQQNDRLIRQTIQKESMASNFKSDIDRTRNQYQGSINTLQRKIQDLQRKISEQDNILRRKNDQLNQLSLNNQNTQRDLQLLKRRYQDLQQTTTQKMSEQVYQKYILYDQAITKLADQNSQLRNNCQYVTNELNHKIIEVNNLSPLHAENQNLKRQITSYQNSIALYEKQVNQRFANFELALQKLRKENGELRRQLDEGLQKTRRIGMESDDKITSLSREFQNARLKLQNCERENSELRSRLLESGEQGGRRIAELQSKIAILSQQLERTNQNLQSKVEENRIYALDIENAKKQLLSAETHYHNTMNNEVHSKYNSYEQTISQLRRKISEIKSRNHSFVQQLQKVNSNLKVKGDQSSQIAFNFKNIQNQYQQYKRRSKETQMIHNQNISNLRKQNQDYRLRFQQYDSGIRQLSNQNHRKTVQYQNKIALLTQQYQRLRQTLDSKNNELIQIVQVNNRRVPQYQQKINHLTQQNQRTRHELNNLEQKLKQKNFEVEEVNRKLIEVERSLVNKHEMQTNMKTKNYQQTITIFTQEKQTLQKKIVQYQNKLVIMANQIQRLNELVKMKSNQIQNILTQSQKLKQSSSKTLQMRQNQFMSLKTNYDKLTRDYQQSKFHLQKYQTNTDKLHGEFQRFQVDINQLKTQRQALYQKNNILSNQIQRLLSENKSLEVQTKDIRLKLTDQAALQKRINEHLALMVVLFAQIQSLRHRVVEKQKQVAYVRRSSLSPHILKR